MWDHPVSSASISRDYVKTLLEKHNKNKVTQKSVSHMPTLIHTLISQTFLESYSGI